MRGDLQALDVDELEERLAESDVLFEGNPWIGRELCSNEKLASVERLAVFLAPLSREELLAARNGNDAEGVDVEALVTDVMRRKLLRGETPACAERWEPELLPVGASGD